MNKKDRTAAVARITALRAQVLDAVEAYNDRISDVEEQLVAKAVEKMQAAREQISTLTEQLREAATSAAEALRLHIEEKTEQWQEGEVGQEWEQVCAVLEEIENDVEELETHGVEVTVEIETLDADVVDELSNTLDALAEL